MAINTSTFESTLQTKLDAVSDAKEMLLLGKALESTVGSIAVSDITTEGNTKVAAVNAEGTTQVSAVNSAGTTQVAAVNSIATSTFKTVGGSSILGSGDIATLPSGGTADQVLTSDASSNATWADVAGGNEIFRQSWNEPGNIPSNGSTPSLVFTPTTTGLALFGWSWSYRASGGHLYVYPEIKNTSGGVLHTITCYGGNSANGNSSWNQGTGGITSPSYTLTAGTTYHYSLRTNGDTANNAGDTGDELHLSVIMI